MHKALHLRDEIVSVSRKEGGRGLTNIEDSIDASIQGLKDGIRKSKERYYSVQKLYWQHNDQQNNN